MLAILVMIVRSRLAKILAKTVVSAVMKSASALRLGPERIAVASYAPTSVQATEFAKMVNVNVISGLCLKDLMCTTGDFTVTTVQKGDALTMVTVVFLPVANVTLPLVFVSVMVTTFMTTVLSRSATGPAVTTVFVW
jgi:hypothetical protein